ncbi:hypothetical protein LXL04_024884 [Taraxacum kok-saghyz]
MKYHSHFSFYISLVFLFIYKSMGCGPIDTTLGFVSQPLNRSNLEIQKPYNVPVDKRYNFFKGVHKLWVFKTNKAHSKKSKTAPRTEICILGYDYSSGVWQFEAYGYVPRSTTGVCIVQVFGSKLPYATTTMLSVYNTSLYYYINPVIISDLYDKWFRLNVIHDVGDNIDGILKHDGPGRGGPHIKHYFKCGVYARKEASFYMESCTRSDIIIANQRSQEMMNSYSHFLLYISLVFLFIYKAMGACEPIDTTLGFVSQPLNRSNLDIQKPYNLPVDQRYSFSKGVHKLWVFKTDKPHSKKSKTGPRTEIRIRGYDYSSGVWQFEAYGYVPTRTTGVCIMQVFGSRKPYATTTMLRVHNSNLYYYTNPVILSNLYNKWFRLNVIHDVEGNNVKVYIDGVLKHEGPGRGGPHINHYFKCGVYSGPDCSVYMESQWKDIRIFRKR